MYSLTDVNKIVTYEISKSKHIFRIFVRKNQEKVLTIENMFDIIQNIEQLFATNVRYFRFFERRYIMNTYNNRYMTPEELRYERRIRNNKIRRIREMRKNFLLLVLTIGIIITGSFAFCSARANANDQSMEPSYKYFKSVYVQANDTLWSIADTYMDEEHYKSKKQYINEVIRINSLEDESIMYGTYLIVPYYDSEFIL